MQPTQATQPAQPKAPQQVSPAEAPRLLTPEELRAVAGGPRVVNL